MRRSISTMLVLVLMAASMTAQTKIKVGADLLFERYFSLIEGKRVGLITNPTGVLSNGIPLADALFDNRKTSLVALFGPEHGIRGAAPAGKEVESGLDEKTGLPVYSLYGAISKPTDKMLKGIDVLIFDIQDVGVRFYTYESTLSLTMEAAAQDGIPFIVLDRPNPIGGNLVEGFVRLDSLRSFVGWNATPILHGMTIGELASMINCEGWLKNGIKADLTVIKVEGWKRGMRYDETGLQWVRPSPNIYSLSTEEIYPGTCLVEGTNLSEGRGTEHPFENIGAPFVDGRKWADELNKQGISGVRFEAVRFTPQAIPNVVDAPKYKGKECRGISVIVVDRTSFRPVTTAVYVLSAARKLFPTQFQWRKTSIDRLAGTPALRLGIDSGALAAAIVAAWKAEVDGFMQVRQKYLLY